MKDLRVSFLAFFLAALGLAALVLATCGEADEAQPAPVKTYMLSYELNGGRFTDGTKSAAIYNAGTKVEKPEDPVKTASDENAPLTKTDFFTGWFDNEALQGDQVSFPLTIQEDITVYADYRARQVFSVSFIHDGAAVSETIRVAEGASIEKAPEKSFSTGTSAFGGWALSGSKAKVEFPYEPKANVTLESRLIGFKAVGSSADHSMALDIEGGVWTWGKNKSGELGHGYADAERHVTPQKVTFFEENGITIKSIVCGTTVGKGFDSDELPTTYGVSVALDTDGKVWTWGHNYFYDLGYVTQGEYSATPAQVKLTGDPKIIQIDTFFGHYQALDENGQVWSWGLNKRGNQTLTQGDNEFGGGKTLPFNAHSAFTELTGVKFKKIYRSYYVSFGLTASNDLWVWGVDVGDLFGAGTVLGEWTFVRPRLMRSGVDELFANMKQGMYIVRDLDGAVYTWGMDRGGLLYGFDWGPALGDFGYPFPIPLRVPDTWKSELEGRAVLFTGDLKTFSVKNGVTRVCGICSYLANASYSDPSLGSGKASITSRMTTAIFPTGIYPVDIAGYFRHVLFLDQTGKMWATGRNDFGELGNPSNNLPGSGSNEWSHTPVQVLFD